MDRRKKRLLSTATRLYRMGIDLEAARTRLQLLADQGVSYSSDEMISAYREFMESEQQWRSAEQQYLALRDEILSDAAE